MQNCRDVILWRLLFLLSIVNKIVFFCIFVEYNQQNNVIWRSFEGKNTRMK